MNKPRNFRRRFFLPLLILALISLLFVGPKMASAHSLDQYLQATYITVAPEQIEVELDLSPGVLVAPQITPLLDTNNDQQISDAEGQSYINSVMQNVTLLVDQQPVTLTISKIDMPTFINIQAGYGVIRVFATGALSAGMTGAHEIYYKNAYQPAGSTYQVNAFVDKNIPVTLAKQNRDSIQQTMTMGYTITTVATTGATDSSAATSSSASNLDSFTNGSEQVRQLAGYLADPTSSPWVLLLGLGLAVLLGGLHALTPGHGKTLVAAYLVGSRGTVKHAVALGGIVTFTHTASVIVIGLLALFASQFIVPNVLVPILEICSGLLVVFMGARLVWTRWRGLRSGGADHDHDHSHAGSHSHSHTDGHSHTHQHVPDAANIKPGALLAMGVSGGLVPCPEALGIMVIAIGLNKVLLGLGLIVSFSLGLAAVLIGIGVLLVRSRGLISKIGWQEKSWQRVLPLASAVIVTALGSGIAFGGLMTFINHS